MVAHSYRSIPPAPRAQLFRLLAGFFVLLGPISILLSQWIPALTQPVSNNMLSHVLIAGACSIIGLCLAWLILVIARRTTDRRVLFIGLAFLANALLFGLHASSTPGFVFATTGSTPNVSSQLSLSVGSFFFLASTLQFSSATDRALTRHAGWLVTLVVLACAGCAWYLLAPYGSSIVVAQTAEHTHDASAGSPTLIPSAYRDGLFLISSLCYITAIWRYLKINQRSPSKFGLALTYGTIMFCAAMAVQRLAGQFTPMFWAYHVEEYAGFLVIGAAVVVSYQQGIAGAGLLESLFLPNTRARIEANYSRALDALIESLARGERPTGALRATLQEQFSLPDSQLQALEQAATAVAVERRQRQELELMTATLQQLQSDKETLLQLVVHDLKNPLTALLGFMEILRRDTLTDEQRELAGSALRSARNLQELIDDLLDVARMEESKLDLRLSTCSITIMLTEVATEMHAWAQQDDHDIRVVVPDDILIEVDSRLLRRVLRNLVSNALKHTPTGTPVTLQATLLPANQSWCRVEIVDRGPGIDAATRATLFERFGRSNSNSAGRRQQSTGLGLFFCRLAVEAHHGRIGVESTEGEGTTFWIELPGAQTVQDATTTPGVANQAVSVQP